MVTLAVIASIIFIGLVIIFQKEVLYYIVKVLFKFILKVMSIIGLIILIIVLLRNIFPKHSFDNTTELLFSEDLDDNSKFLSGKTEVKEETVYVKVIPHIIINEKKYEGKEVEMNIVFRNTEGCDVEMISKTNSIQVKQNDYEDHSEFIVNIPSTYDGKDQGEFIFSIIADDAREIPVEINYNKKMSRNKSIKSMIYFLE